MKKLFTTIALLLAFTAQAQSIKFATGAAGKGYSPLFGDINNVCGTQVPMQEVNTTGGLDNINALADKTVTLGLVPYDVLQSMAATDPALGRLKAVASLNNNLLHIIAAKSGYDQCGGVTVGGKCVGSTKQVIINNQNDLKGLTVGLIGSAKVTGRLYVATKVQFTPLNFDTDAQALDALRKGQIQAYMTMAAWPSDAIKKFKDIDNVKLVAWSLPKERGFNVVNKNYPNLGQFGVPFLASPNLLMARAVDPTSDVGKNITKLRACISNNLNKLKDTDGTVASWDEVASLKAPDDVSTWSGK